MAIFVITLSVIPEWLDGILLNLLWTLCHLNLTQNSSFLVPAVGSTNSMDAHMREVTRL
jgi:hypothetical protein